MRSQRKVETPEEIAANPASYTGQYLKQVMHRRGKAAGRDHS
jgi:hypothetical protein